MPSRPPVSNSTGSINSFAETGQGDGGHGSLSFASSIIGHDDPTLVHANNVKVEPANKSRKFEKDINSIGRGGIESFLTASFSDEDRNISQNITRTKQTKSEDELRQQLNELDQTEEAWKAKQRGNAHDLDEIGDFYVKEAGENSSSPSMKQGGTIYADEKEQQIGNGSAEVLPYYNHDRRSIIDCGQQKSERLEDIIETNEKLTTVDYDHQTNERLEDIIKINKRLCDESFAGNDVVSLASRCKPSSVQSGSSAIGTILNISSKTTARQIKDETGDDMRDESTPSASNGFESDCSDLNFEYPSTDEQSSSTRRMEPFFGEILSESSASHQTVTSPFVDIENNMFFTDTKKNVEPEDTDKIIKEVQKRLYDSPTNTEIHSAKNIKSESWIPIGSDSVTESESDKSRRNFWGKSRASASKTGASDDGEDVDPGYNRTSRRRNLYIMNSCLVILIIAAIICAAFFTVEMIGSRRSRPVQDETSVSTNAQSPTTTPSRATTPSHNIEDAAKDIPINTQMPISTPIKNGAPSYFDEDNDNIKNAQSSSINSMTTAIPSSLSSSSFIADGSVNNAVETPSPTISPIESAIPSSTIIKDNTDYSTKKTLLPSLTTSSVTIEATLPPSRIRSNTSKNNTLINTQTPTVILNEGHSNDDDDNNLKFTQSPATNPVESAAPSFPLRDFGNGNLRNTQQPTRSPITNDLNGSLPAESSVSDTFNETSPNNSPLDDIQPSVESIVGREGSPIENVIVELTDTIPSKTNTNVSTTVEVPNDTSLANLKVDPSLEDALTIDPTFYSDATIESLEDISGDFLFDVSTPQYAAYDWILNNSGNYDIDNLTEDELNDRYIAALFYFSLNGDNWSNQYGFLEDTHVCEWNNGSSRHTMGVICDNPYKIAGFAISK